MPEGFANAASAFAGDPVFYGVTRNVSSGRTALRVVYSVASNTTNTYNPLDFRYKGTETAMLATNGLLHTTTSGGTVGEPKFALQQRLMQVVFLVTFTFNYNNGIY